jgi:hypothetical protein
MRPRLRSRLRHRNTDYEHSPQQRVSLLPIKMMLHEHCSPEVRTKYSSWRPARAQLYQISTELYVQYMYVLLKPCSPARVIYSNEHI